jgi:hypothetical protein
MQAAIDNSLSDTQYGCPPQRSTSHAIYAFRRIRDFAEAKGTQFSLALLDWEKTFDKAQHDRFIFALKKLGSVNTIVISLKIVTGNLLFS